MNETDLHALLRDDAFTRLVRAFYARVETDDLLGPMYRAHTQAHAETLAHAEERLRLFLVQRFGGPGAYSQQRGHPRLRTRHAPFPINDAAARRWIALMEAAMTDAAIPPDAAALLRPYFTQTALFMVNKG
jgi:hemoglobin